METKELKNKRVVYNADTEGVLADAGVTRTIKAYSDDIMCVENVFETGAVGALHSHPHTQLTYILSGKFRFTVGDEVYEVGPGDTLLKKDGVIHGCTAIEGGVLLYFFTPMRKEFVE